MKKIIIIGSPGSGKTTFAVKLAEKIGISLFHLDSIWHRADKTHISREEFDSRLGEILSGSSWIIDGNYSRTIERRINACDTVVFFDLPVEVCLEGAISRIGKERPDMPWCDTELDAGLKEEIERFPTGGRLEIYELIEKYKNEKRIIIFNSREASEEMLSAFN